MVPSTPTAFLISPLHMSAVPEANLWFTLTRPSHCLPSHLFSIPPKWPASLNSRPVMALGTFCLHRLIYSFCTLTKLNDQSLSLVSVSWTFVFYLFSLVFLYCCKTCTASPMDFFHFQCWLKWDGRYFSKSRTSRTFAPWSIYVTVNHYKNWSHTLTL